MLLLISIPVLILAFLVTYLQLPFLIKYMHKKGKVGIDIHKKEKPKVADMGGLSIIFTTSIGTLLLYFIINDLRYIIIISAALIAAIIGLVDDFKNLGGKLKPALTLFTASPILLTGYYNPHPSLPFISSTRLTIVYPLGIPVWMAITSNAVNMLDVINGATPLLLIPIIITLIATSLYLGNLTLIPLLALTLGSLIAFYLFNKYPAKVFMGNTGDFFLGALIGAIAITYSLEMVVITAMLPYIMNGFYALASLRRFFEKSEIKIKPVEVKDDMLFPSTNLNAHMTLTRIILSKKALSEKQLAYVFFSLACVSSILAFITGILTKVRIF